MKEVNMTKNNTSKTNSGSVKVLITTENHIITGELRLPANSAIENPTTEDLLFDALNCGNKFIALRDCTIGSKREFQYRPEHINYYNINLNIVQSCQIIKD